MSEQKHTPGPWEMWTSCSFRRISSKATGRDGDVLHAVVQHSDGHPDLHFPNGGFDGPDARLMLAAPEMHDALLSALSVLSGEHDTDSARQAAEDAVRSAIAKATGVPQS